MPGNARGRVLAATPPPPHQAPRLSDEELKRLSPEDSVGGPIIIGTGEEVPPAHTKIP